MSQNIIYSVDFQHEINNLSESFQSHFCIRIFDILIKLFSSPNPILSLYSGQKPTDDNGNKANDDDNNNSRQIMIAHAERLK